MVSRAIINGWPLVPPSRQRNAPINVIAPSISGNFSVGSTLTLSDGTWDGFPALTLSRVWLRDGLAIPGATGSTYVLTNADAGHYISATVLASNALGTVSKDAAGATLKQGGGVVGPYPAPAGYEWAYLVSNSNQLQTSNNNFVVLKRVA